MQVTYQSRTLLRVAPVTAGQRHGHWIAGSACIIAFGVVIASFGAPSFDSAPSPTRRIESPVAAWTSIAESLEDRVPPEVLMGGPSAHAELDVTLRERGLTRNEFRSMAGVVLRAVGPGSDRAACDALAASLEGLPLPEDVEIPAAEPSDQPASSPDVESARALVLSLAARMNRQLHVRRNG